MESESKKCKITVKKEEKTEVQDEMKEQVEERVHKIKVEKEEKTDVVPSMVNNLDVKPVEMWNLHSCRRIVMRGPKRRDCHGLTNVCSVDYKEELKLIVEGADDGTARCFDTETKEMKWRTELHKKREKMKVILIGHNRDRVLCIAPAYHDDGVLAVLELDTGAPIWKLNLQVRYYAQPAALDDVVAIVQERRSVYEVAIIDIPQGRMITTIPLGERNFYHICKDQHYVYAQLDSIKIWSLKDGSPVADVAFHGFPVTRGMCAFGGKLAYVTKDADTLKLIVTNTQGNAEHKTEFILGWFENYITKGSFSVYHMDFDGKHVLVQSNKVLLWDMKNQPRTLCFNDYGYTIGCALEGDVAVVARNHGCNLFDVHSGSLLVHIPALSPVKYSQNNIESVCLRRRKVIFGCTNDWTRMYDFENAMAVGTKVWARTAVSNFWLPARIENPPEIGRVEEVYVYMYGKKAYMWLENSSSFVVPYEEIGALCRIGYVPQKKRRMFKDAFLESGWPMPEDVPSSDC